jgi:hypothetical protein
VYLQRSLSTQHTHFALFSPQFAVFGGGGDGGDY